MWWSVFGCGGMCWDVVECGGMWRCVLGVPGVD